MDPFIRFSGLARAGLQFRRKFEAAKQQLGPSDFVWYSYDCFSNLFYLQQLLKNARLSWTALAGARPVLDVGAADGALSFFLESLGHPVHACDHAGTNANHMRGIRTLAAHLASKIQIHDIDLDARDELPSGCGVALFLGTLYHVKNPFYILESLAKCAEYCFLSTRVARLSADKSVRLETMPVGYLLEPAQCNSDVTNYWIFSPAGLRLLVERTGWEIRAEATSGPVESDPVSNQGDERMFLLLESKVG